MKIILYAPPFAAATWHLLDIVRREDKEQNHESFEALETFANRLRHPLDRSASLVILCPADAAELGRLTAVAHLLRDLRVILMLPDRRAGTITAGHLLRPRFVGYADGDLNDVAAVVKRMAMPRPRPCRQVVH